MINAAVKTLESKQYWAIRGWLPERIGLIVEKGKVFCFEGEDLRLHIQRGLHEVTVYALVGIVADVNGGEHQKSHLVSLIDGEYYYSCYVLLLKPTSGNFREVTYRGAKVAPVQRFSRPQSVERRCSAIYFIMEISKYHHIPSDHCQPCCGRFLETFLGH